MRGRHFCITAKSAASSQAGLSPSAKIEDAAPTYPFIWRIERGESLMPKPSSMGISLSCRSESSRAFFETAFAPK